MDASNNVYLFKVMAAPGIEPDRVSIHGDAATVWQLDPQHKTCSRGVPK